MVYWSTTSRLANRKARALYMFFTSLGLATTPASLGTMAEYLISLGVTAQMFQQNI